GGSAARRAATCAPLPGTAYVDPGNSLAQALAPRSCGPTACVTNQSRPDTHAYGCLSLHGAVRNRPSSTAHDAALAGSFAAQLHTIAPSRGSDGSTWSSPNRFTPQ